MARKGRTDRGLYQRPDAHGKLQWHVRLVHNGKEHRTSAFNNKTEARNYYDESKAKQRREKFFPGSQKDQPLAVDWIETYVASLETSGKSQKTQYEEKRYAKWWKGRLSGKRLKDISLDDLDHAKGELIGKGYKAETIKHYLKSLRQMLNKAKKSKKLEATPFVEFDMPQTAQAEARYLKVEEEVTLLEALGEPYAKWARLAIVTGLRKTELFSLRWANIDLENGLATLPKTKSGKVQYAQLNTEAVELLRTFPSWENSVWVFPSKTKGSHLDTYNFYGRIFLPAVKRAKLEGVTWHSLRHTFASRLGMTGQNDITIAASLRHSGTALVQRYTHTSNTHLQQAIEGVSGYGKKREKDGESTGNNQQTQILTGTKNGNVMVGHEQKTA